MTEYRTILRDEVPNDDGTSTGRVFVYTQRLAGLDHIGDKEWIDVDIHGPYEPKAREVVMRAKRWFTS